MLMISFFYVSSISVNVSAKKFDQTRLEEKGEIRIQQAVCSVLERQPKVEWRVVCVVG